MVNVQKILVLFLFVAIIFSCTRDTLTEVSCDPADVPVYTGEVELIINRSCAYTGCHISGTGQDDYTDFEKIVATDLNKFHEEVSNGDMPPFYATPSSLTAEEILTLRCWIQGGNPEN